jgi:ligand-binding sensor domain-containing protein/uncharacterized membrane-anchored protein YhcB (DUF1043 family)
MSIIKRFLSILLVLFLIHIFLPLTFGQLSNRIQEQIRFNYINVDNGLNNNRVRGLAQDSYGFIWIGTSKGISRFDGYNVVTYDKYLTDSGSIKFKECRAIKCDFQGRVWAVGVYGICYFDWTKEDFIYFKPKGLEDDITYCDDADIDKNGDLWFATNLGILKYNPVDENFQLFTQEDNSPNAPGKGTMEKILAASNLHIWYGLRGRGVGCYNPEDGIFTHYLTSSDESSLGENRTERLYEDSDGNIWIGHNNRGASKYNYSTKRFYRYMPEPDRKESGRIRGIAEDKQGNFWFGTQGGLYLFNKDLETFKRYAYAEHPISTLSHNSIQTMLVDNQEGLWLGTFAGGVSYTNLNSSGIIKYEYSKIPSEYYLNDKSIYSLAFDNNDNIWVGTENGGLNFLDRNSGKFTYYSYDPLDTNTPKSNNIKDIIVDKNGIVWFGTYKGGMSKFDPLTSQFTHYQKTDYYPQGFNDESIFILYQDAIEDDWIWVAATRNLYIFHKETETIEQVNKDSPNFLNTPEFIRIYSICHSKDNKVIFGSNKIMVLNRMTNTFKSISEVDGREIVQTDFVFIDKYGYLWAAINTSFIIRYDLEKDKVKIFDKSKGLPEIDYLEGAEDSEGNLWLSTNKGIWKLENIIENQDTFNIVHYDNSDNVQSLEFVFHSKAVSPTGEILFGGANGFNSFIPEKVKPNPFLPNVIITRLSIAGEQVQVGEKIAGKKILDKPIMESTNLHFHHKIKVFTFHFAGSHYVAPENNQFKYMLEGYDEDWQFADANVRSATYSNIPRGTYTFKVDASNNNGKFSNNPFEIKVKITPPFWKTAWFTGIIILLIGLLIYSFILFREKQLKHDKEILQQELEKGKNEIENSKNEIEKTRLALEEKEKQERVQKWHNEGLAKFSDILTREKSDLVKLTQNIINCMVEFVDVQQGGIFLADEKGGGEVYLELTASYAFNDEMLDKKTILAGEGQVGACFSNKKILQIDDLPDTYIKLTSGLGESTLPYLLLMPIMYDEQVVGVLELASFEKLEQYKVDFLQKVNESIVSIVSNLKAQQTIEIMLEKSKMQTEELMGQEEEMRQNMEEMLATQEEASRREKELNSEIEKYKQKYIELQKKHNSNEDIS